MKRIFSLVLCLVMILSMLPANVFAASTVSVFRITVTEPKEGEKPVNSGSVPATASTEVVKVEWKGDFNDDGTFADGERYTVEVTVKIKDGTDKTIRYFKATTKINGVLSELKELSENKKQAVFYRTFDVGSEKNGETVQKEETAQKEEKPKTETLVIGNGLSVHEYEWEVLRLCNIERAKEGLDSLSMNVTLQDICDVREKEIETVFSHDRPDGSDCYSAVPSDYEWNNLGENIARGQRNPAEVVESWMNSPGHRANILNPEFSYMGVGYNSDGNHWVQFFSSSKKLTSVTKSSDKEEFSENGIKDVYLTITASNGYVSYMPADFASMKQIGDKYYPRLVATQNVSFVKVEEEIQPEQTKAEEKEPTVTNPNEGKTTDIEEGSLFEKYIPITHVYGTNFGIPYNMEAGSVQWFSIGTQFYDETVGIQPSFAPYVKRCNYQNHYVKLNYLGTYGTIDEEIAVTRLGIIDKTEYDKVMRGEESDWAKVYNLTKDTIVISAEIYDANKKFVRKLTPAGVIVATDADGNFITFSKFLGSTSTILYSQIDNFFKPDEDKSRSTKSFKFVTDKIMLTSKADAEKLLPPAEITEYEYKTYTELDVKAQYNTNHLLDDDEFVSADNVYYQVGVDLKKIDPVIKNEIKDVVSYSYYTHTIDTLYTQRNIVTADGTLYGVTSEYEKKKIATNVKKTTANHYLTKGGEVKELSGKTVATDVFDYEESNDGWVIGILKNDGSFHMGYTYIEGKDGYARGISKMKDNVKCVVPNGLIDNDDTFWRWDNAINVTGIDANAFSSGEVIQSYDMKLNLVRVCSNAERVFPYEYLAKIWAHSDENRKQSIYGFVQSKSGRLYGYSSTYHQGFNTFNNKVERIFPVFSSNESGNFVGIKIENEPYIDVIACRYCDGNIYRYGPLEGADKYVCETQSGYYGEDGRVYGLDDRPVKVLNDDEITPYVCVINKDTNLPNMYRKTATYRAYSRETDSNIPLLPNVYTWKFDSKRTILLERTDGSVWMASVIHPSTNADLVAMTGGYESSNVFKVSPATTKKSGAEYVNVSEMPTPAGPKLQFTDVAEGVWYADAVKWAVGKNITAGTSATTFSPDNTCTRAQILTFLWRAVGSPKMSGKNPFGDVKTTDYFYNAALWAYEKGMVTGSTFAGETPCTRSATVVYLWKNAGSPYTSYYGTFSDVKSGSGYASAVAWAVNNGITSGTSTTTFSPDTTCTRGQIVTFLLRTLK